MYLNDNILPSHGISFYFPTFINDPDKLMQNILNEICWRNDKIKMFGKVMDQPRKVAWYGDQGVEYTYSGIKMKALEWSPVLMILKLRLEEFLGVNFNSVLINLYRDGNDYMSWHSDDEKELGKNPVIASVSLGCERDFLFRMKSNKLEKVKILLENGSLLVMQSETQHFWQHSVPKRKMSTTPRLNLTFRNIK